ncbi:hypothetical protein PQX77_008546 [Marasmius sp. AFHP31]|nr:hypothetical protein PQX77_008546 [Marasmius sp. AFHP31]
MAIDVGFRTEKPFQELEVTRGDLVLGSIVFGWFLGFVVNVAWTAVLETRRSKRISYYIVMIWLEILADVGFSVTTWLYLYKVIPPGLDVFLTLIICWILQAPPRTLRSGVVLDVHHCQSFVYNNNGPKTARGIIGFISISSACIWIPAQLQINHQFMALNHWWDRFEKSVYLCLDLSLNILFIVLVKKRLVDHGLKKYLPVFKFNLYIIFLSISMDIVLLGVTALKNGFVYCQFHPVVYIVKLQIEMNMSRIELKESPLYKNAKAFEEKPQSMVPEHSDSSSSV